MASWGAGFRSSGPGGHHLGAFVREHREGQSGGSGTLALLRFLESRWDPGRSVQRRCIGTRTGAGSAGGRRACAERRRRGDPQVLSSAPRPNRQHPGDSSSRPSGVAARDGRSHAAALGGTRYVRHSSRLSECGVFHLASLRTVSSTGTGLRETHRSLGVRVSRRSGFAQQSGALLERPSPIS